MGIAASILRATIRGYQLILSPFSMGSCRYLPSCSQYALDAVEIHGAIRGGWLAFRRLLRCHPWGPYGYDPAPSAAGEPVSCCRHEIGNKAMTDGLIGRSARPPQVETL